MNSKYNEFLSHYYVMCNAHKSPVYAEVVCNGFHALHKIQCIVFDETSRTVSIDNVPHDDVFTFSDTPAMTVVFDELSDARIHSGSYDIVIENSGFSITFTFKECK